MQLLLAGNLNVNMRCLQQRGIPHTIFLENKKGYKEVNHIDCNKTIRKSKGLSQQELAIKLNVVRQTVSKWETGVSLR